MPRFLAVLAVPLLASCATIFQPGPDPITIATDPPGATVHLDNTPLGRTPVQLMVARNSGGQIRIEKDGYQPVLLRLPTSVNGTVFLNIFWGLIGGPIAFAIDFAGGNGSKWTNPASTLSLVPVAASEAPLAELQAILPAPRREGG